MIHEFNKPIPRVTPLVDGYILYVKSNGFLENDEFCIIMCDGGDLKHFTTDQIKIYHNKTYSINKQKNNGTI